MMSALLTMMQEQPYNKIKVQDITGVAGLARQTFYLHYSSKDALLLDYIDDVFDDFYQEAEGIIRTVTGFDPIIPTYVLRQWQKHKQFSKLVVEADVEHLIVKRFQNYVTRIIGLYIRSNPGMSIKDPEALKYAVDYFAGASWMILRRWLINDCDYPIDRLSALFYDLLVPGLTNLIEGDKW